jgi:glycosyltransferase 2 family protein
MNKRLLSILQYVLFLGGGIFLVWWQLRDMDEEKRKHFYDALNNANYWLIFPIICMALLSHLSRSMRWKLLMEPLGYDPALKNVFASTMVGYLANSAIPRLGEILKCGILAKYEKLKVDKLVGTIVLERTFTVLIQLNLVGNYFRTELSKISWLKAVILVGAIVFIIVLLRFLLKEFPHNKVIIRINTFIKGIGEGFKTIKKLKKVKLFIAHTIFIWSMYLLQIYLGFRAMEGTSGLSISAACSVLTLATLAMIATPGGIGVFPIFVMETLILYGISTGLGQAFGWLIWGVSTSILIITGFICLIILPYINRKKEDESDQLVTG